MGVNPNKLESEYFGVIEHNRRQLDDIWNFMHHDAVELREGWLAPLYEMIIQDQPTLATETGVADELAWLAFGDAPQNVKDVFYWICAWLYPNIKAFLQDTSAVCHPSEQRLGFFLHRVLPGLCHGFLHGVDANPSVDNFARKIRSEYIATVGVATDFSLPPSHAHGAGDQTQTAGTNK